MRVDSHRFGFAVIVVTAVAAVAAVPGFAGVQARTADSSQDDVLDRVQARCGVLKTRLRLAQETGLTTRIRLGRAYDSKILPLISAFNSRVAANNVNAPELIRIAAELREATGASEFGHLYTVYADDLTGAINSNCRDNPAVTYGWIQKARVDKAALAEQVDKIDALIGEYIAQLKKLKQRFEPAINKPGKSPGQPEQS